MRKKELLVTLTVILSVVRAATAVLVCDESVFDFGEADETEVLNHVFTIRNAGDQTIRILRVQSSCGCATPGVTKDRLEPGDTTELSARINLRGRSGRQNYSLSIRTDHPEQPVFRLGIRGNVIRDMTIDPQRLNFHWPVADTALSGRITLVSGGTEFAITGVTVSDPVMTVIRETVRPGLAYALRVDLDPEKLQPPFEGSVTIETDHPRHPTLSIPVSVVPGGGVEARPTSLTLAAHPADVPQRRMVIVYSRTSTPFTIERVTVPQGAESSVRSVSPHRHDIHIDGLLPGPDLRRQSVTIKTSLGETIEIPFRLIE